MDQNSKPSFWNRLLRLSRKKKETKRQASFETLETSGLENVQRAVIFLNKTESCFAPPPARHVQFAPTPDKENRSGHVSRRAEVKLLNVTCVDGPQLRTPSLPRTSTKKALVDRKNAPAPLNVSSILQYHSLPRKVLGESNHPATDAKSRGLRQSCYGVSDPSRIAHDKKAPDLDPDRRFSLGPPRHDAVSASYARSLDPLLRPPSTKADDSRGGRPNVRQHHASTSHLLPNRAINEVGLPMRKGGETAARFKSPHYIPLSETFSNRELNAPVVHPPLVSQIFPNRELNAPAWLPQVNQTFSSKELNPPQMSQNFSNRALNARTKPPLANDTFFTRTINNPTNPSVVSETFSNKVINVLENPSQGIKTDSSRAFNARANPSLVSEVFSNRASNILSNPPLVSSRERSRDRNPTGVNSYQTGREPQTVSETRRRAILSAMQAQKRRAKNKLCRHISNHQSDEGFSSMADDECSFDCSCSACVAQPHRKSRGPKPGDQYFFEIGPELPEETDRLPESRMLAGPMALAQPRLVSSPPNEKTWYECNDTLCETPKEKVVTPKRSEIVDNIYENITRLLNSATRKNLTPRDVRKWLSTPKSTRKLEACAPDLNSDRFDDSLVLLQEIFQKLSHECREWLRPDSACDQTTSTPHNSDRTNLPDLGRSDLARSLFSEAGEQRRTTLAHSTSLPDLQKKSSLLQTTARSSEDLREQLEPPGGSRQLPDGWSETPPTSHNEASGSGDSSKCSEGELRLLENVVRLGMGLGPKPVSTPTKAAARYKSRDVLSGRGKLKLRIYYNAGLVTVYVIKAAKLEWTNGRELNAYVKITLVPDDSKRVHWRTNVQKDQRHPTFNQKLSFELLSEDATKRLVFSVWHRDYVKQRSELIGCMSFSVRHVMDNTHDIDGWYRLLRERFGTQKHFAAHTRKSSCSSKK